MYEFIDPPGAFEPLSVWRKFLAELERERPRSASAEEAISLARSVIARREGKANAGKPPRRTPEAEAAWRQFQDTEHLDDHNPFSRDGGA